MSRPKPESAKPQIDREPLRHEGCGQAPDSESVKLARLIDQAKSADVYLVSHIANLEVQLAIARGQLADVRLSHAGLLRSQDAYSALAKH